MEAPPTWSWGGPFPGRTAHILDDNGRLVPVGSPGELTLGGRGLARGVSGPAGRDRAAVPDPFSYSSAPIGTRLYRTGDRARFRPDGTIEFLGRLDRQVKLRGFRIEPGEIEDALLAHAGVREAAVVPTPGESGGLRLAAYVVARNGTATPAELRTFLAGRLPAALVPTMFTLLPALPRTVNGKLDRQALPAPARAESTAASPVQGPTEETLAEVWRDLLGIPRIGREDGFFALGGHSLLATRLLFRLRERFGVELPLSDIFDHSSLAELAARIDSLSPSSATSAFPGGTGIHLPLDGARRASRAGPTDSAGRRTVRGRRHSQETPSGPDDRPRPRPVSPSPLAMTAIDPAALPPLPEDEGDIYAFPASFAQRRLWFRSPSPGRLGVQPELRLAHLRALRAAGLRRRARRAG